MGVEFVPPTNSTFSVLAAVGVMDRDIDIRHDRLPDPFGAKREEHPR